MEDIDSKLTGKDSGSESHRKAQRHSAWRVVFTFALIAALLLILFYYGYHQILARNLRAETTAKVENGVPIVNAELVRRAAENVELMLPGNVAPLTEAYIYARASGYVKKRYVDMGDIVQAGALLAEIEAPELDQQVQQARATLAQADQQIEQAKADLGEARARLELTRATWDRYKVLVDHGAVSKQDGDQQFTLFKSTTAVVASIEARVGSSQQNVQAIRANVDRVVTMQEYKKVFSPIAGVVTARNFDVGALISASGASMGQSGTAGSAATGAQGGELFRIAQIDRVRVLISVPESSVPGIKLGQNATVVAPNIPGRKYPGIVARTANAVDFSSRTMLTEIQVENEKRNLLPGMFVNVTLVNKRAEPPLLISGDSIMTSAKGLRVAMLQDIPISELSANSRSAGSVKRVHLQEIQVGRDFGSEIEVLSGLQGTEWIVRNPGDQIEEGAMVQTAARPSPKAAPGRGTEAPAAPGVR